MYSDRKETMMDIQSVVVYCGSSPGKNPNYMKAAKELGECMLEQKISLVYGSGKTGLMGEIAKTVHEGGGKVTGVTPGFIKKMYGEDETYGDEIVVDTMHERKHIMVEMVDAFIALPGGYGTMEELLEITTWAQLKRHTKPIGLLNVDGYYDGLLQWIAYSHKEGFIPDENKNLIIVETDPRKLLEKLKAS